MGDLVSIIMPCYNACKFITKAINSIINQTYTNWELIIVNDGSIDETDSVVKSYIDSYYKKIKYISQSNYGVSIARNVGLNSAKGDFVMFLDADDSYAPEFIKKSIYCLIHNNSDVCYSLLSFNKIDLTDYKFNFEEFAELYIYNKINIGFYTGVYKKEIIDRYSIRFPTNISYGEDQAFIWQYLTHVNNIVLINEILYFYVNNKESVMHKIDEKIFTGIDAQFYILDIISLTSNTIFSKYKKHGLPKELFYILDLIIKSNNKLLIRNILDRYDFRQYAKCMISYPKLKIKFGALLCLFSPKLYILLRKNNL